MSQPPPPRAPGSFSSVVSPTTANSTSQRPPLLQIESSSSEEQILLAVPRQRTPVDSNAPNPPRFYTSSNNSSSSLQNFSRPNLAQQPPARNGSPLTSTPKSSTGEFHRGHSRKTSQTQGSFEPYLSTAATSNLGSMANPSGTGLSASQIAAQAAMQQQSHHMRQRSQTVPTPQLDNGAGNRRPSRGPYSPPLLSLTEASAPRETGFGNQVYHNGLLGGGHGHPSAAQTAANVVFAKAPGSVSPGTSASPGEYETRTLQPDKPIPKEKSSKVKLFSRPGKISISKEKEARNGALPSPSKMTTFASLSSYQRGNMSTNSLADTLSSASSMYSMANSSSATIRAVESQPEKVDKEKHKHHFLSRQKHKLSSKDDHHLPLSSAASNSKPVDPSAPSSLYNFSLPPSPGPTSTSFAKSMSGLDLRHGGRALREKKKEEKSDALRESELSYQNSNEWQGPSSLGSAGGVSSYLGSAAGGSLGYPSSIYGGEVQDLGKYGLNNMTPDDAWPFLKARLLVLFEGEDLRLPVEDFNRLVTIHLRHLISHRSPHTIITDLQDLLTTGFLSLDQTLRRTPDDRLIPHLVEMWLFTFTSILPSMQAVFLPLDLEFSGTGPIMSPDVARDFWGALPTGGGAGTNVPAGQVLEVRRFVLLAYRDIIILPRFDVLKTIFSRLSLDSLSLSTPSADILSTSPDSFSNSIARPGTAMSNLDPAHASYGSQNTTLLGGASSSGSGSVGNRSRAISNVSYGSEQSNPNATGLGIVGGFGIPRPYTPTLLHSGAGGGFTPGVNRSGVGGIGMSTYRDQQRALEDPSKRVTETVGRLLQCLSVLASVGLKGAGSVGLGLGLGLGNRSDGGGAVGSGVGGSGSTGFAGSSADVGDEEVERQSQVEELARGLKLNWLGRGRMGRNRRGLVGARVVASRLEGRGEGVMV